MTLNTGAERSGNTSRRSSRNHTRAERRAREHEQQRDERLAEARDDEALDHDAPPSARGMAALAARLLGLGLEQERAVDDDLSPGCEPAQDLDLAPRSRPRPTGLRLEHAGRRAARTPPSGRATRCTAATGTATTLPAASPTGNRDGRRHARAAAPLAGSRPRPAPGSCATTPRPGGRSRRSRPRTSCPAARRSSRVPTRAELHAHGVALEDVRDEPQLRQVADPEQRLRRIGELADDDIAIDHGPGDRRAQHAVRCPPSEPANCCNAPAATVRAASRLGHRGLRFDHLALGHQALARAGLLALEVLAARARAVHRPPWTSARAFDMSPLVSSTSGWFAFTSSPAFTSTARRAPAMARPPRRRRPG